MNQVISFTPGQLVAAIISICAGLSAVSGAIAIIVTGVRKMKAPEQEQNRRIAELERKVAAHDRMFDNDKQEFEELKKEQKIVLQSLLALLAHGVDGNEIHKMEKAKDELERYLLNK